VLEPGDGLRYHGRDTLAFHAIAGYDMIRKFGYRECPGR
jgi:hypothetical protein